MGNDRVRARRDDLAGKEELTFGQIVGLLIIIIMWILIAFDRSGSQKTLYFGFFITILIATIIVRFNK